MTLAGHERERVQWECRNVAGFSVGQRLVSYWASWSEDEQPGWPWMEGTSDESRSGGGTRETGGSAISDGRRFP